MKTIIKTTMKVLIVFALVVAIFSQSRDVLATDVYKFKGYSAAAFFSDTDPSGCIFTGGSVFVFENISHSPPGPGSYTADVLVDLFKQDICTGTTLMSASNMAPAEITEFNVAGNLDTATVVATVPMFDYASNTAFDLTVDLTWTGTSPLGHQSTQSKVNFAGCHTNLKNNSAFRYAEAFGTVSDGTTNFTPSPSEQGSIFLAKGGDFSHGCN
jgi:hypothetical protein